jgi:hypothetical protein
VFHFQIAAGGVAKSNKFSQTALVIAAALVAAALKLYCASTTYGSLDVTIHARFGQIVDMAGLDYMYQADRHFNHTPLTGEFFALIYHLSAYLTPPAPHAVPRSFPFLLRLPSILADFLAVLMLLRFHTKTGKPPTWAITLFALSPVAFMVSGFHGNVDSIMVCVLLAATYFCVEKQAMLSAFFLALACAVKVIPLFLAPVFFFFWFRRDRKRGFEFAAVFGLSCLAAWSTALLGSAGYFFKNVLGYSSYAGGWGVTYWCVALIDALHGDVTPKGLDRLVPLLFILKVFVIVSVMALAWVRRKASGVEFVGTIALAWTCFAVFAPGFIPYYLVWPAPFVLLYSASWYVAITAASSIYLFAYYNIMAHGMPWNASDPNVPPAWNDWGTIPWFVLVAIGLTALIRSMRSQTFTAATAC